MSKQLLNTNGEKLGEITLNEAVFGVEPNLHVMHLALRRQLNKQIKDKVHKVQKQEQKFLAAERNLGNKKVQDVLEQVL